MPTAQPKGTSDIANAGFSHLNNRSGGRSALSERISPDFLVLIIDVNPLAWKSSRTSSRANHPAADADDGANADFEVALKAIIIFLNAHIAMQHENGLAIYAAGTGKAQLLYTSAPFASRAATTLSEAGAAKPDANTYQHFKHVDDKVVEGIKRIARDMRTQLELSSSSSASAARLSTTAVVSALSQALCHLNRLALATATNANDPASRFGSTGDSGGSAISSSTSAAPQAFRKRILILSVTPDASTQYIPMMNCIFAAQKKSILIDVCKVFGRDTVFLQQAAHLTGGTYFRIDEAATVEGGAASGLLQCLMSAYLPSRSIRDMMHLPMLDEVDFRAACFCHRRIVDIGYVCSVCLSLFCEPRTVCLTCKSKYPAGTLARYSQEAALGAATRAGAGAGATTTG
ncbi:RNA polymerase II transcription factor B subunit 4 [Thecaphora frezii]